MSGKFIELEPGYEIPGFKKDDYTDRARPRSGKPSNVHTVMAGVGRDGKPSLAHRAFTDVERMAICVLRGKGLSNKEIAEQMHRHEGSIARILKEAALAAKAIGINYDWREDVRVKAVDAVRAGLTAEEDPYKRGGLGIQALKGLGDFEADSTVNVAAMISQVPEHMRARYITSEPEPNQISSESEVVGDGK